MPVPGGPADYLPAGAHHGGRPGGHGHDGHDRVVGDAQRAGQQHRHVRRGSLAVSGVRTTPSSIRRTIYETSGGDLPYADNHPLGHVGALRGAQRGAPALGPGGGQPRACGCSSSLLARRRQGRPRPRPRRPRPLVRAQPPRVQRRQRQVHARLERGRAGRSTSPSVTAATSTASPTTSRARSRATWRSVRLSFGHATLEIKNRTHAYFAWLRNHDGAKVVADAVWLTN